MSGSNAKPASSEHAHRSGSTLRRSAFEALLRQKAIDTQIKLQFQVLEAHSSALYWHHSARTVLSSFGHHGATNAVSVRLRRVANTRVRRREYATNGESAWCSS